jgi:iron complex transport system substrate-binding protein
VPIAGCARARRQYGAYTRGDGRVRFLEALGFTNSQKIEDLKPSSFHAEVSKEKVALLDADLTIVFGIRAAAELKKDTVLNSIPSAEAGKLIVVDDADLVNAFSTNSVLSTPYTLEKFLPTLKAALA